MRVVPDVAREEFLNAGVVLFAKTQRALLSRIALDEERLLVLAPGADVVGHPLPISQIDRTHLRRQSRRLDHMPASARPNVSTG